MQTTTLPLVKLPPKQKDVVTRPNGLDNHISIIRVPKNSYSTITYLTA